MTGAAEGRRSNVGGRFGRAIERLWAFAGLLAALVAAPAGAQVATLDAWSNPAVIQAGGLGNGPANVTVPGQTVSGGTNRLLVVAVVLELSGNDPVALTASFGGTAMTSIATSGASNTREHAALFYLLDADIPGGAQTLSVGYSVNGGGGDDVDGIHVYWGSYSGVDQTSPLVDSAANSINSATITFASQVDYVTNGLLVYAAGNGGLFSAMTTVPAGFFSAMTTVPAGFSEIRRTGANGHASYIAETAVQASNGNYAGTSQIIFTAGDQARSAVAVASLRPAVTDADLSITKTDGTATYVPGGSTTYTIVVSNAGPAAVTGATVTDTFPAAIVGATWTCAASAGSSCPASGSGDISTSAVNLLNGGTATFTVTAPISAGATGNLVNTATVAVPAGVTDPTPGNDSATDTDTAAPQADLGVVKSAPASLFQGDPIAYTITVTNAGPSNVSGATVADTFVAGVVSPSWTCVGAGGGVCTAGPVAGNINDSATIPAGGTVTYTVSGTVDATFAGNLGNTATVSAPVGTTDPVPGNDSSSVSTSVVGQTQNADVRVTKSAPAGPLSIGTNVTYTIQVFNDGPATAANVVLTDPLPTGTSFFSSSTTLGSCSGTSTVTCTLGAMANGASATITIVATIDTVGTKSNTATVTNVNGTDYDPDTTNNSATASTTVAGPSCAVLPAGGVLSGVINTYFPGTASVTAGVANTCIPVGTSRGAAVAIAAGDILLVIQMQDADISSTNDANYGGNNGTGAGAVSVSAGRYEFVVARGAIGAAGCAAGQVGVAGTGTSGGLVNAYANANATATKGQARFQVVRVPQYSSATLNGVRALPWRTDDSGGATNGLGTGGIVALDVAGALTINAGVAVDADGMGFRGAAGRQLKGGLVGGLTTDYRTLSPAQGPVAATPGANGGKGEGNAGTPRWVYEPFQADGTTARAHACGTTPGTGNDYYRDTLQPNDGYPNGSMARGAPGNAGGGSTDGRPAVASPGGNDENSGGGGGSNGGAGGRGGFSWNTGLNLGGLGAAVVPAVSQLVLGGGGGGGTRNNDDCAGGATAAQEGQASSGAAGGGLIAIRANTVNAVAGAILSANGAAAYNDSLNDGGGGGGAGGSIVLTVTDTTVDLTNLTLRANGGRGGDAWRTQAPGGLTLGNRHGPGGGGGGGVVVSPASFAVAPVVQANGGAPGITTTANDTFGALAGGGGQQLTAAPGQIPGVGGCTSPDPTIALVHSPTSVAPGGAITITATVTNVSTLSFTSGTVTATITLAAGFLSPSVASSTGWTCGAFVGLTVTCTRADSLAPQLAYEPIVISATANPALTGQPTLTNTATVSGGGDVNALNNSASDPVGIKAPTLAHLLTFDAVRVGGRVELLWQTDFESNNVGFRVHRESGGVRELLTPSPIAGSALFVGRQSLSSGRSYSWLDEAPSGDAVYWLEDIDTSGATNWNGPVIPRSPSFDRAPLSPSKTVASLQREARREARRAIRGMGFERRGRHEARNPRRGAAWQVPGRAAAKLMVEQEGWYRVTRAQLAAAGYDPGSDPDSLELWTDGVELALRVDDGGDGRFDDGDAVEFYGVGFDSIYDRAHVYWLTNGRRGLRVEQETRSGRGFAPAPTSFPFTVELKERVIYFAALVNNGDAENFYGAVVWSEPALQVLELPHPAPAGEATLTLALQGITTETAHYVDVRINGHDAGALEFSDQEHVVRELVVPAAWLLDGANQVTLTALGAGEDVSLVDYVKITYPRQYRLDDGALRMQAPVRSRVTIDGLADESLRVVDVTDPERPRELPVAFSGEDAARSASVTVFDRWAERAMLLGFTPDRVLTPVAIVPSAPSRLIKRRNQADFVIISHASLLESLEPLRAQREAQGLTTQLIDVADVYDEFAYGQKTPAAIRDFLAWTSNAWRRPPSYVLLAGDASFDPKDYLGFGDVDLLPTKLIPTTYLKTSSDDWFVDFDEDGFPDMAIGRFPARTAAEATLMVTKTLTREAGLPVTPAPTGDWTQRVALVADRPTSDFDFEAATASVQSLLPADIGVASLLARQLGGATRNAIIARLNEGQLLVNFSGHGSVEVWGKSPFFSGTNARALSNGPRLPIVVAMNCLNGLYSDLYTESLAEGFLKAPNGGAAAVWASSALTEPDPQALMDEEFFRLVFQGGPIRLGDAVRGAKAVVPDEEVRRTWILLGDPTQRVR